MSNLTFLNDASVLYNLRSRYKAMLIYVSYFNFSSTHFLKKGIYIIFFLI
jgi:hypothetical protein